MDEEETIEVEGDEDEYSSVYFELSNLSNEFLEEFFKDEVEVVKFNIDFRATCKFQPSKQLNSSHSDF